MAVQKNFDFIKGDSRNFLITVTAGVDGNGDPIPKDITGSTVYFTMKVHSSDADSAAIIQIIVTSHTDPLNGITTIPIVPSDWDGVDPGSYEYDIQITFADLSISTLVIGKAEVINDVTKA